jgi:hypothetical protein
MKFKISLIIIAILTSSLLILTFHAQEAPTESNSKSDHYTTYLEMPDGEKVIVEVRYEDNTTKLTVKLSDESAAGGLVVGSEEIKARMSEDEIKERALKLIWFFRKESRHQAMSRIIFWGMENGIPSNESTKAANEFGECIDAGKNPDECVQELKGKYEWISKINFSDFVLLYKRW